MGKKTRVTLELEIETEDTISRDRLEKSVAEDVARVIGGPTTTVLNTHWYGPTPEDEWEMAAQMHPIYELGYMQGQDSMMEYMRDPDELIGVPSALGQLLAELKDRWTAEKK